MTKDDLDQIDQLIQKRLDANNKQLRQEIRADTKAEVDPLHERLDTLRGQIAGVEKNLSDKITLEAEDVSEIRLMPLLPARSASCRWRAEDGLQWPVRHQMRALPEPEG